MLGPRTSATSLRWFHLHSLCCATLIGSHQRYLPPSVWQSSRCNITRLRVGTLLGRRRRRSLVGFRLLTSVCNAWQLSRTQNVRRALLNSGPIFTRLWTKVHQILQQCRRPLLFTNAFTDCLRQVSFRRYSPLSLEVIEKPNKCKSFWPPISSGGEKRPRLFYGRLLARFTVHHSVIWLSSVC